MGYHSSIELVYDASAPSTPHLVELEHDHQRPAMTMTTSMAAATAMRDDVDCQSFDRRQGSSSPSSSSPSSSSSDGGECGAPSDDGAAAHSPGERSLMDDVHDDDDDDDEQEVVKGEEEQDDDDDEEMREEYPAGGDDDDDDDELDEASCGGGVEVTRRRSPASVAHHRWEGGDAPASAAAAEAAGDCGHRWEYDPRDNHGGTPEGCQGSPWENRQQQQLQRGVGQPPPHMIPPIYDDCDDCDSSPPPPLRLESILRNISHQGSRGGGLDRPPSPSPGPHLLGGHIYDDDDDDDDDNDNASTSDPEASHTVSIADEVERERRDMERREEQAAAAAAATSSSSSSAWPTSEDGGLLSPFEGLLCYGMVDSACAPLCRNVRWHPRVVSETRTTPRMRREDIGNYFYTRREYKRFKIMARRRKLLGLDWDDDDDDDYENGNGGIGNHRTATINGTARSMTRDATTSGLAKMEYETSAADDIDGDGAFCGAYDAFANCFPVAPPPHAPAPAMAMTMTNNNMAYV